MSLYYYKNLRNEPWCQVKLQRILDNFQRKFSVSFIYSANQSVQYELFPNLSLRHMQFAHECCKTIHSLHEQNEFLKIRLELKLYNERYVKLIQISIILSVTTIFNKIFLKIKFTCLRVSVDFHIK